MENYGFYENLLINEISKQSDSDPASDWGTDMNILFISDNAPGRRDGLIKYFTSKTQLSSVHCCEDAESAKEIIDQSNPDAVVYVATQKKTENYALVKMLKNRSPAVFVCMYAHIDPITKHTCKKNGIKDFFSDKLPVRDFIKYLNTMIERTKAK